MLEMRQQYAFYGVILYVAATIFVLFLTLGDNADSVTWNALFWVTQLFVCINAVAKSFLQESRGRMLYFYSIVNPAEYMMAKLLYNLVLMAIMNLVNLILFTAFMGNPTSSTWAWPTRRWSGPSATCSPTIRPAGRRATRWASPTMAGAWPT